MAEPVEHVDAAIVAGAAGFCAPVTAWLMSADPLPQTTGEPHGDALGHPAGASNPNGPAATSLPTDATAVDHGSVHRAGLAALRPHGFVMAAATPVHGTLFSPW